MSARYCNPSAALIGHAAPFTDQERRYSAWGDWGYPCTLCQGFFNEMMGTSPDVREPRCWFRGSAPWAAS